LLNEQELKRYHRQLLIFNQEGQERLKSSRVFIAGGGGLGCPIALYLAVAGVGCIEIADGDVVEKTNLNRQVLHWEKDTGKPKVLSIQEKIRQINPYVNVIARNLTINEENVMELVKDADIIVDALDNFSSRYLLNRAAVQIGIPLVHGAVRGFDGQIITIIPGKTACLKCVFPATSPEDVTPVIGVTPAIIGTIQANEVLKCLLRIGEPLQGRLLIWDGLNARMDFFAVERRKDCDVCGDLSIC